MISFSLPDKTLEAESPNACAILAADDKFYIYSLHDNRIYECDDYSAGLTLLDSKIKDDYYRYTFDVNTIKSDLETSTKQLLLNVTEDCNMRCTYCAYSGIFQYERIHGKKDLDESHAYEAIDYYMRHSSGNQKKRIAFYGGEPLLKISIIRNIVNHCRTTYPEADFQFSVTTNGNAWHDSDVLFLAKANMIVTISIDGPQNIHDSARQFASGIGSWARAMKFVEALHGSYDRFLDFVGLSITIHDYTQIEEVHRFFRRHPLLSQMTMSVGLVDWSRLKYGVKKNEYSAGFFKALLEEYCTNILMGDKKDNFLSGIFDQLMGIIWSRSEGVMRDLWPGGCCVPGLKRLFLSSDGLYYPCERVGMDFSIGDISSGPKIERIIGYLKNFAEVASEYCNSCWVRRLCPICLANSRKNGEIAFHKDPLICRNVKDNISQLLSAYISVNQIDNEAWHKHFDNLQILEITYQEV